MRVVNQRGGGPSVLMQRRRSGQVKLKQFWRISRILKSATEGKKIDEENKFLSSFE